MSAVDEVVAQIEENAESIPAEALRQKLQTLGDDEWCTVLLKIASLFRQIPGSEDLLDAEHVDRIRSAVVILNALDIGEVNFREMNELAEAIGALLDICPNAKLQKNLSEILLNWIKKEWLQSGPSLYNHLRFVAKQVRLHKKTADIKNLSVLSVTAAYAVRCSTDATLVEGLCSLAVRPNVFEHADGRRFTIALFEQAPLRMHDQMKIMLSTCDKTLGKGLGDLYYRCLTTFSGEAKEIFLQQCMQDIAYWSLCMADENLAATIIAAMVFINRKMKITKDGSDDLFDIYEPFLLRMTEVPNSTFRCRSARLLCSVYPLLSSKSSEPESEELKLKQLAAFERLLEDDVPFVRAATITGLCELASYIAEALPTGWLQKILGKFFVRLAFDTTSPDVRLGCVKGLARIVENHVLWPLAERLVAETKHLLHDKALTVRAAYAQLLDKIVKLHAFKPWKFYQSQPDYLPRLAEDDATVCRPLTSFLMEHYLPPEKDAVWHLERCITLVQFNELGARNFYSTAMGNLTFLRATAFIEIVLRHMAIKSSRIFSEIKSDVDDADTTLQSTMAGANADVSLADSNSMVLSVDGLLKLTGVAAACWLALLRQLRLAHNSMTAGHLEKLAASGLPRIFRLCEHFHRDPSNVIMFASCLPWRTVPVIFHKTVGFLRRPYGEDENIEAVTETDAFRQTSDVAVRALTNWAKLSELLHIIHESVREGVAALRVKSSVGDNALEESKRRSTRKRVRFDKSKAQAKENSGQAGIAALAAHLGLLDMLLSNRSSFRQLQGKELQMREIWDELASALDLIGSAAMAPEGTMDEVNRHLLLCFDFYFRVGMVIHVDSTKAPAVVDDNFLKQTAAWLRSHSGIFSGGMAKPLTDFQVGLCRTYLKQLTSRIMLNSSSVQMNDTQSSSSLGPSDIFEMALDAAAFIPTANRRSLAETVITLVYASVTKLATLNRRLSLHERGEHMRILISYLTALDDGDSSAPGSVLVHATDCFVLLALLSKRAEKIDGRDAAEEERISECFTRLVSVIVKSQNAVTTETASDQIGGNSPQEKRRTIGKKGKLTSDAFHTVISRFYPHSVRSILGPLLPVLDRKLEDPKLRPLVAKWLVNIGYSEEEIPEALAEPLQAQLEDKGESEADAVEAN